MAGKRKRKGSRYGTLGDIVQLRDAGRKKKKNKVEFGGVSGPAGQWDTRRGGGGGGGGGLQ